MFTVYTKDHKPVFQTTNYHDAKWVATKYVGSYVLWE